MRNLRGNQCLAAAFLLFRVICPFCGAVYILTLPAINGLDSLLYGIGGVLNTRHIMIGREGDQTSSPILSWYCYDFLGKCGMLKKSNVGGVDGFSNYMVDLDGYFIIIRNVPCHKCGQCGWVSYSGEAVAKLEEIVAKLKETLTEVAIVEYAA